ncbi:MAG TPA: AAA family ATPase [Haliangiales bacterium]|nr:AAA family ATPase [Haliangiales bacterium]
MGRVIAVVNQKGGVGKTTTAVNLAASLANAGRRVLLVDFDPQGNASSGVGYPRAKIELTIYDALLGDVAMEDVIRPTEMRSLFVAPASTELAGAEIELVGIERREARLRELLAGVAERFDLVVIDCPPSLGILTVNALCAAEGVIVPMQCEYYALEGLSALLATIERVRKGLNPRLAVDGILFCMHDPRPNLTHQVTDEVKAHLGKLVFDTVIPRTVRLSESPSYGKPILLYDKDSRGCQSYLALAEELLLRRARENREVVS